MPGIMELAFSPDGKTLASAGCWANVKLWELSTGKSTATLDACSEAGHLSVVFSLDGKTLASFGVDERIKIWDVASGESLATVERGYRPSPLAIRSVGIAGTIPGIFEDNYETVESVSFTPNGKIVALMIDVLGDRSKIIREVFTIPNGRK
jgi:WD40 repeat protein